MAFPRSSEPEESGAFDPAGRPPKGHPAHGRANNFPPGALPGGAARAPLPPRPRRPPAGPATASPGVDFFLAAPRRDLYA